MKPLSILIANIAVLGLAVPVSAGEEVRKTSLSWHQAALTDGAELYQELCAVCHGVDGKGDGPAAPELEKAIPDLTVLASVNSGVFPAKEVRKAISGDAGMISHGTLEMPIWRRAFLDVRPDVKPVRRHAFAYQQIDNLTAHLKALQEP